MSYYTEESKTSLYPGNGRGLLLLDPQIKERLSLPKNEVH